MCHAIAVTLLAPWKHNYVKKFYMIFAFNILYLYLYTYIKILKAKII